MGFNREDLAIISDGKAHTHSVDPMSHRILRYTPEEVTKLMGKVQIEESYRRRLRVKLEAIKELIDRSAPTEDIITAFLDIKIGQLVPFYKLQIQLKIIFFKMIQDGKIESSEFGNIKSELEFFKSVTDSMGLGRFQGGGGADIISMNKALQDNIGDERISYFLKYIEIIINYLLSEYEAGEIIRVDRDYLDQHSGFMNMVFTYCGRNYHYILSGDSIDNIPRALFDVIITLFPLHLPILGDDNRKIEVRIGKNTEGTIIISGSLGQDEKIENISHPKDLIGFTFDGLVEASRFLQSIVDRFPDMLEFKVNRRDLEFHIHHTK